MKTPEDELILALAKNPDARSGKFVNPELSAVYVIGNSANRLHKIGFAENLRHRFSGLNCGSPVDLHLKHFVYLVGSLVAKNVEARTHQLLAEQRRRGEWFDVDADTAANAIAQIVNRSNLNWWTEHERRDIGCKAKKIDMEWSIWRPL